MTLYEAKLSKKFGNQSVVVLAKNIKHALEQLTLDKPLKLKIKAKDIIFIREFDNRAKNR